jgi:hypothetical protein
MENQIVSSASVNLNFVSGGSFSGAQAQFDAAKLINTWRVPIEVRELRVMIEARATRRIFPSPWINLEMKLGRHYLTDGRVPISIMAPYRTFDEFDGGTFQFDNTTIVEGVSQRRIIFPKPLVLPPGLGFMASASLPPTDFFTTSLFNVDFAAVVHLSMIGRLFSRGDRVPRTNDVPIISHVTLTQSKLQSFETDLRNPLSDRIRVHRMIGAKIRSRGDDVNMSAEAWFEDSNDVTNSIDIRFPDGSAASEMPIEFASLFGQCRVWPASFDMDPSARIRAKIPALATEVGGDAVYRTGYQIALFGTRPEVI